MTTVHPADDIRIFVKECRTLAAAGYRVHLVAPGTGGGVRDGVHVHAVPAAGRGRLVRMTRTVACVGWRAWRLRGVVYHFHDPELIPVGLLLRVAGRRVIYDVHEHLPWQIMSKSWVPRRLRPTLAALVDRLERFAARGMSAIVAAEPPVQERFHSGRTVLVGNFPIPEEFSGSTDWAHKQPIVCYVGAITEIRGAREMVRSVALAGTSLSLAGAFSPPQLEHELMAEPGWSAVISHGRVGRREVARILAESIAGLVVLWPEPNYIRAEPTKMYEYMSAGIPVIASSFPGWRDLIERHDCGISVDPMSVSAVAAAIRWLIEHPQDARRMGENGRAAAERHYNWHAEARKLVSLYGKLVPLERRG